MKFVWPPLTQAMQERQKKIAEGLDAAGAERDLQLAQERAAQMLRETKEQAAEILDRANKTANAIVEEAKAQARSEGEKLIAGAKAEIDLEVNRAKDQLRAQVAALGRSPAPSDPAVHRGRRCAQRSGRKTGLSTLSEARDDQYQHARSALRESCV